MDEFVFVAPELGVLVGVLLGPELGAWYCDEVNVASSRAHRSQRFVCRDTLGGRGARPAAWLTPVPAEAVVYGSGDAAVILSKACATTVFQMCEYCFSSQDDCTFPSMSSSDCPHYGICVHCVIIVLAVNFGAQEQAAALRSLGMAQYDELKGRLLLATTSLVAMGTGVAYLLAGLPLAAPFVVGGGLGVAYQLMLQSGVDALPLDPSADAIQVCS